MSRETTVTSSVAGSAKEALRVVKSLGKTSLAIAGAFVVVPFLYEKGQAYREDAENKKEKGVLVIPFHRLKLMEKKKPSFGDLLKFKGDEDETNKKIEMEIKELVNLIHEAAKDDNITALWGDFGSGSELQVEGLAHVEELRRAIRVFNESHRTHYEPGKMKCEPKSPKQTFAYAHSFGSFDTRGNMPYLLASSFQHVSMQHQGRINLFGVGTSTTFVKPFLDKYGIKAHVFKHGPYKNAPNRFTHKNYNKPHLEATKNLVDKLDEMVCSMINDSRFSSESSQGPFTEKIWKAIRAYGPLTSLNALELGLLDTNVNIDPLGDMVKARKIWLAIARKKEKKEAENEDEPSKNDVPAEAAKKDIVAEPEKKDAATKQPQVMDKWGRHQNDLPDLQAAREVTLDQYKKTVLRRQAQERANERVLWFQHKILSKVAEVAPAPLEGLKIGSPYFNIPKEEYLSKCARDEVIAIVHVHDTISTPMALRVVDSLRKIKKNTKIACVVLRVDSPGGSAAASEQILMELADLPQPVICSMGNYAASGGYYVAAAAHRIFALPTTITGSIGVYMIKFDVRECAKRYGIHVEHVTKGPHSVGISPFAPLNKETKRSLERGVGDCYDWFKTVVATGRGIPYQNMDAVAQGRVWTGMEAKEIGLVDELGGLDRAVAYAQRNFTVSQNAKVEVYPKTKSRFDRLLKLLGPRSEGEDFNWVDAFSPEGLHALLSDEPVHTQPMLSMDENDAVKMALQELAKRT